MNSLNSETVLLDCQAMGKGLGFRKRLNILLLGVLFFFVPGTVAYFFLKHAKENVKKNPNTSEAFQLMWHLIDK